MGFPYHELIPPAVLLDNPGITNKELGKKLQSTHYSDWEVKGSAPWDSHDGGGFTPEDLPRVLGLKYSPAFLQFQQIRRDQNGVPLFSPRMRTTFEENNAGLVVESFQITTHLGNELGETQAIPVTAYNRRDLHVGKVVEFIDEYLEGTNYLVLSISERRAEAQQVTPQMQTETFTTLEDVYKIWPQFSPENMYDFSQSNGGFISGWTEGFLWKLVDGKYYLDEATFDQIPAGFSFVDLNMGYTDLILTAEAIKHGAWKLLSRRGLVYLGAFLRDYPDSRARYEQAVWDSQTSLAAKNKGMTNTEFIRMRLFPSGINSQEK